MKKMKYVSFSNEGNTDKDTEWCRIHENDSPRDSGDYFTEFRQGRTNATGRKMDKFMLLMWKNWKLQIRHPVQSIFEIIVPVLLCGLVVYIKNLLEVTHHDEKIFTSYPAFNTTTLLKYDQIMYSPNTSEVIQIMRVVQHDFPRIAFLGCENEQNLQKRLVAANSISKIGVVFDDHLKDNETLPNNVNIKLRFPSELHKFNPRIVMNWRTNMIYWLANLAGPRNPENNFNAQPEYYEEGFLTLQQSVSQAVIKYMYENSESPPIYMQRYPYPAYDEDILLQVLQGLFGLFFVLGFLYNVSNITKYVTVEKERQLKECMKIMGLPNWLHWAAWFAKSISFLLVAVIIITILYKINFGNHEQGAVLPRSNGLLVFVFLVLYVCAITTFGFLFSSIATSANIATSVAALMFFLSFTPYTILIKRRFQPPLTTKLAASLSLNTAMAYGFETICVLESAGEGLQWSNIWHTVTNEENLVMGHILLMLLFDSILYMLLALYIEAVFPGKYGVPKKWNFIFTWSRFFNKVGDTSSMSSVVHDESTYEPEPTYLKPGIQIIHLNKTYKGNRVAVDDVSLSMFENQITVLLGHNGAGKTTTISMITGLFPPTKGKAIINGYDVATETNKVRSSLGFCPQYNVLFDELTVAEHIYFFSRLKGVRGSELNAEINYYINLLKLEPKRNVRSDALSGGMKRKLSVAMAFCGKSKVVLLDEPTSGMDPAARRALWDVVESEKTGRTILLSTHFMDEADILGDRIAIMARGKLQCCGSSFFLKKKYGSGYLLVLEKTPTSDVALITSMLSIHIKGIQLRSNIGSELTYQLNENDRPVFQKIFSDIEMNAKELGIVSYGVSLTTLEDVFLKVGSDTETNRSSGTPSTTFSNQMESSSPQIYTGGKLISNQIKAMFLKRALITFRGIMTLVLQILIPVIILILAILPSRTGNKTRELPNLKIDFKTYGAPISVVCSDDSSNVYYQSAKSMLDSRRFPVDDLGDRDVSEYMLNITKANPSKSKLKYIVGACFNSSIALGWFNNIPLHSPPLALNLLTNSILKSLDKDKEITIYNHPTPYTLEAKLKLVRQVDMDMGYAFGVNIGFCLVFLAGFYVIFYVKERTSKAKHLQMVSGVNPFIFWMVSYIWDWLQWLLVCLIIIIMLLCFQEDGFRTSSDISRIFVILLYSIFALLPVIYFLSFKYDTPAQGYVRATMIFSLGVVFFIVYQILSIETLDLKNVADIVDWPFLLHPLYSMASGIRWTYREYTRMEFCEDIIKMCIDRDRSEAFCRAAVCTAISSCCEEVKYFQSERPGILRNIIISLLSGLLLLIFLMVREYKLTVRLKYALIKKKEIEGPAEPIDRDVEEENAKVRCMTQDDIDQHSLVLRDLTKYYKKDFLAVNRLCLAVDAYQCFGLLGVNGAGKTTTFKMITGDISISQGDIFIKGLSMKTDSKSINTQTGYCPQFDALFDELTVKETMRIFCLIRGYHGEDINNLSANLSEIFDLNKHVDKKVMNLSGGNKRKLSTAVAMIGDPPIIYLDEPTTGMDPATKRHLWNALCDFRDSGKCLVLTSHSMEECEALCTRLAIMVQGRFKCIGSLQHLKSKFSQGYTLTIKLKRLEEAEAQISRIEEAILQFFPDAVLKEHHHELITFRLPGTTIALSTMFKNMESAKNILHIDDYSISQCGLEEVFLSFTNTDATEEV